MTQAVAPNETVPYEPIGAARDLFYCRAAEILIEGPAGTGKSRGVLEKVHLFMQRYPGSRGLLVRKTRASMTESVLVTFEDKVLPPGDPMTEVGGTKFHRKSYDYPNGSHLAVGGMDNPSRIMSTEYDIIAVFEATELVEDEFEKLTTRLRNNVAPYQQIIADCNPEAPSHWLNRRANAKNDKGEPRMVRLLSRHKDNPSVTPEYLSKLDGLTGARRLRLRHGNWAVAEGMVYEVWDADKHMIGAETIRPGMVRWTCVGVDWGFRDPGVMQVWGVLGDGVMVRLAEHYHTGKTVPAWWAKRAQELKTQYAPRAFVCDPAEPAYIAEFRQAGLPVVEADNDIPTGISRVRDRLAIRGDGRPGLMFLRDGLIELDRTLVDAKNPAQTVEEFESYVYDKPKEQRNFKEVPVDFANHGMDAMRYAVAYVDRMAPKPSNGPTNTPNRRVRE
jgi:PBSX family phage terminase large subunit